MKRLITLGAAFLPLALVAGFSQYLDVSALDDIPDECKQLSGSIAEYGVTEGSIWTPADVQANAETGILELNSESTMTYFPVSLDDYVRFGAYDDTASIEAFMNRGSFYKTDRYGEQYLAYTSDDISRIYTEMEDANYDTFEAICSEVTQNLERYSQNASKNGDSDAIQRASRAIKAWKKFVRSGMAARSRSASDLIKAFADKAERARTEYWKARSAKELRAAQESSANMNRLNVALNLIEKRMDAFLLDYMNGMNTIGAYLGSTNSMAYFSADLGDDLEKISDEDLDRWFKFSNPEPIPGSDSYYNDFRIGGRKWYTAFHNFQSEYFVQALPLWSDLVIMDHFGMTQMRTDDFRGFYERLDDYNTVTNWYAARITAPKNWADGASIVVTNGKFRANAAATRLVGTASGNEIVIGGPSAVTNTVTFAAAQDSNVSVSVGKTSEHNFTVTIGVYYK